MIRQIFTGIPFDPNLYSNTNQTSFYSVLKKTTPKNILNETAVVYTYITWHKCETGEIEYWQ